MLMYLTDDRSDNDKGDNDKSDNDKSDNDKSHYIYLFFKHHF